MKACFAVLVCALSAASSSAQAPTSKLEQPAAMCPAHTMVQLPNASHDHDAPDHEAMNHRGETGMGFSQTETAHHFFLTVDGGIIQVEAKGTDDATNPDNIRMHLHHIARAFKSGDFDIPMFVHDKTPPGVPLMRQHSKEIRYAVEDTPNGGRVVLRTNDKDALAAIHDFLRFQITEHKTGDPLN
jgi:hypothetical protein